MEHFASEAWQNLHSSLFSVYYFPDVRVLLAEIPSSFPAEHECEGLLLVSLKQRQWHKL